MATSSCGACKFLRRRCSDGCIFAPYFSYEQGSAHFAAVHKVFGASNASKLLLQLPAHRRGEAAIAISFEAQARMCDPVYGCVSYIFALQQQAARLQEEIESLTVQLTSCPIAMEIPDPQALLNTFLNQTSQLFSQENIQRFDLDPLRLSGTRNLSSMHEDLQELLPEQQMEAMVGPEHCNILLEDFAPHELKLDEDVYFPFDF